MKNGLNIEENVYRMKKLVALSAERAGRIESEIEIVAVAKFRSLDEVNEVVKAGIKHIGESRVQEAIDKYSESRPDCVLRFVGHLQSNKALRAAEIFDAIDSVDSIKVANRLNEAASERRPYPIMLQVNISGEKTKSGFAPEQVGEALEKIGGMKNLKIDGLMTIGPLESDEKVVRSSFRRMRELFDECRKRHDLRVLSMGMTEDFRIAIEEGTTMIRIGRAIFEGGWL